MKIFIPWLFGLYGTVVWCNALSYDVRAFFVTVQLALLKLLWKLSMVKICLATKVLHGLSSLLI